MLRPTLVDKLELNLLLEKLRLRRRKLRMTQQDVAERMFTNQTYVSYIEWGNSVPRVDTLQRMARALGLRLRFVLEEVDEWKEE